VDRRGDVPFDKDTWELYHIDDDFSESVNVADKNPEKLAELTKRWDELAEAGNVYPLNDDLMMRIAKQQDRLFGDRKVFTYYAPGAVRLAEKTSAPVKDRSHTIETTLNLTGKEAGVIVACGGLTGGYTLYVKDGKLHYDYNAYNMGLYSLTSAPLPRGKVDVKSPSRRPASDRVWASSTSTARRSRNEEAEDAPLHVLAV